MHRERSSADIVGSDPYPVAELSHVHLSARTARRSFGPHPRDRMDRLSGAAHRATSDDLSADVTADQRRQALRTRSDRLQTLGMLASGLAHDFNNLLQGIMGNVSLAREHDHQDPKLGRFLEDAELACHRAAQLTERILTFARGEAPMRVPVNMRDVLRETMAITLGGSEYRSDLVLAPDLWNVHADPAQIAQVFHNLLLNAKQAMPHGGALSITSANMHLTDMLDLGGEQLVPGDYLCLSVADEGVGIAPQDLPRIFEPFFTTKAGSTGLGLATAYFIVQRHGGVIQVRSELGHGTVVDLYLPAIR